MKTVIHTFSFVPQLVSGIGSIRHLKEAIDYLQMTSVLIVCSKRTRQEVVRELPLGDSHVFIKGDGEPTTFELRALIKEIHRVEANGIVAVGGGSVLDLAKAASVFCCETTLDLKAVPRKRKLQKIPLIAVPTTAGTGSEVTKIVVITDEEVGQKRNPAHPAFLPDYVIADPNLTRSLPRAITAETGLDALAHAIEAFVSTQANPVSDLFACEAIRNIHLGLGKACINGLDIEARERMLMGSLYAGLAFSNSSTNLAHAMARPLGTRFHLPHGLSVALVHPYVVAFGAQAAEERYAMIEEILGDSGVEMYLRQMNEELGIWESARERLDIQKVRENIPLLVADALSGNGIQTNRRLPKGSDIERMYKELVDNL